MKCAAFTLLLLGYMNAILGQGAFSNSTHSTLQKVLEDYSSAFSNIRGELVDDNMQPRKYYSKVTIQGSLGSYVVHFPKGAQSAYSWKCIPFEADSYNLAERRFEAAYKEISNSIIRIVGLKPYILSGAYSDPSELQSSHEIVFQPLPASGNLQQVKVELTMLKENGGWKIFLLVYDQEDNGLQAFRDF